ncbi:MAG: cell division protein ZapA [Proteobacteria bacterium]|nr:cell division protein ZapA [Pseudomonadota bacterium]
MEEPFQIEVMGQKFTLKGNYDKDYVSRVEKHINDTIQEVQKQTSSISTHNLLVLVALNLVDMYLKKEEEVSQLIELIEGTSEQLINLIDCNV